METTKVKPTNTIADVFDFYKPDYLTDDHGETFTIGVRIATEWSDVECTSIDDQWMYYSGHINLHGKSMPAFTNDVVYIIRIKPKYPKDAIFQ